MTHPFAAPVPWEAKAILWATLAALVSMPFGRRDGWTGWTALLVLGTVAIFIWVLMIRGMVNNVGQWWRGRSTKEESRSL